MKLTLLLIPFLFFMTSCTVDWNDEKDIKIAALEKQINQTTDQPKEATKKIQHHYIGDYATFKELCISDDGHYDVNTELGPITTNGYVKVGTLLFYFRDIDYFRSQTSQNKTISFIGYRFSFWKYDCIIKQHSEIVSEHIAQKILELLPKTDEKYWPFVFGGPPGYTFFNNTLQFIYITGSEEGGPMSKYDITINTKLHDIYIDKDMHVADQNLASGYSKNEQLFSTGFSY